MEEGSGEEPVLGDSDAKILVTGNLNEFKLPVIILPKGKYN